MILILLSLIIIISIIIILYSCFDDNILSYFGWHKKMCREGFCVKIYGKEGLKYISQLFKFYDQLVAVMPCEDIRTMRLQKRFNKNRIFEVSPNNKNNWTSYTIDKGEQMGLCLKDKNNIYHDINTLKFVFLHELGHVISNTYHHDLNFWTNFKFLLNIAYRNNLIELIDYDIYNTPYCGIVIDYNPYLDYSL